MSQYIIHAAPYSSPNSIKRIKSNWAVQNLKVFQENPSAGGGVFAKFDLVNTSNPKGKKYMMQFSFADQTSMTANAINRIRKFFDAAYDRQRNSSYGFPQLSDTDKTQIVARINTAYNQFAGFSHSDSEDVEIIDCTGDEHLEHKASVYTNPNNNGKLATDSGQWVSTEDYSGNRAVRTGKFTISYGHVNGPKSDPITTLHIMPDQGRHDCTVIMNVSGGNSNAYWFNNPSAVTQFISSNFKKTCRLSDQECSILGKRCVNLLRKHYAQHEGYYSPNLSHSDEDTDVIDRASDNKPDYLSVKMSDIN